MKVLAELLRGLQVIGVEKWRAWDLVTKVAFDSMPALRQKVVLSMIEKDTDTATSDLATRLGYPTNTTRRTLEDLACYGIVERQSQGLGKADIWRVTDWTRSTFKAAMATLPEIRKGEYTLFNKTSKSEERICGMVAAGDTGELPNCPKCGLNEWSYSPTGELLCPCGKKEGVK